MRGLGLGLTGIMMGLSLGGCGTTGSSDAPHLVAERLDLTTLDCHELDVSMYNNYAGVTIYEEAAVLVKKKIRDSNATENDKKLEAKLADALEEARKQKIIDPLVASYRSFEKEYKARCKESQPKLAQLKKEHPSKHIR
jgi:hypothetical protein